MKKQKTLLNFVLIAVTAVVTLCLATGCTRGKTDKIGDDVKTVSMLTDMEDVTYVQYKNAKDTVTLEKKDGVWKSGERPEFTLMEDYVNIKVAELGKIEGKLVTDVVKADCGLEEPVYALTVRNAETTVNLVVGVSEDGVCYAIVDGKDDIYEIKEEIIDTLDMSAEVYAVVGADGTIEVSTEGSDILVEEEIIDEDETIDMEEIIDEDETAGTEEINEEDITIEE